MFSALPEVYLTALVATEAHIISNSVNGVVEPQTYADVHRSGYREVRENAMLTEL